MQGVCGLAPNCIVCKEKIGFEDVLEYRDGKSYHKKCLKKRLQNDKLY